MKCSCVGVAGALASLTLVLLVGACGGSDGDGQPAGPVFRMSADEMASTFEAPTRLATEVEAGIVNDDLERFLASFTPSAVVIDPIDPSLTPSVGGWFRAFGDLCSTTTLDGVFVNVDGALTAGTCSGFYRILDEPALPETMLYVRHQPIADRQATELMHRLDADVVGAHPVETVVRIGFGESRGAELSEHTAVAEDVGERFERAWSSSETPDVAGLYAPDARRHDAYVGELAGFDGIAGWMESVRERYPFLSVTIDSLYASGLGPAAIYELTMAPDGEGCAMRVASVWNLSEGGLIDHEHVYYDAETIFSCGWAE